MPPEPLIVKYRPSVFDEVVGHDDAMRALQRAMKGDSHPHAYLLTGPKGTGKTTIGRLIATSFDADLIEIDAASHSKVEEMRQLVEEGQHMSLAGTGIKMFLIDECHRLSRNAFDALLKTLEEPPPHLYLALCTTEANKVPETIVSRCYPIQLRPLKQQDMDVLLDAIAGAEGWNVVPDVMAAVIQAAEGSPRQALTMLQSVHDATSRDEVRRIVSLIDAGEPLIALLQLLLRGKCTWTQAKDYLSKIEDDAIDDAVIHAGRYICGAMLRSDKELDAQRAWTLLEALTFPATSFDRKVLLYVTIGRLIWGNAT
jgi:DNA polymerase III subunit gamma/tau